MNFDLKLTDIGEAITEADLTALENEMDLTLPADFKAFMLKNNGGTPEEDIEVEFIEKDPETGEEHEQGCDIQYFSELKEIPSFYENLRDEEVIPEKYLSVACDSFGNEILLCADRTESYGKVFFGCHDIYDPETGYFNLSVIADTFTEFLNALKSAEI